MPARGAACARICSRAARRGRTLVCGHIADANARPRIRRPLKTTKVYEPFYADFGPLNLGRTYRFCEITARLLRVRCCRVWLLLVAAAYCSLRPLPLI
jgi:hypothetical protein